MILGKTETLPIFLNPSKRTHLTPQTSRCRFTTCGNRRELDRFCHEAANLPLDTRRIPLHPETSPFALAGIPPCAGASPLPDHCERLDMGRVWRRRCGFAETLGRC